MARIYDMLGKENFLDSDILLNEYLRIINSKDSEIHKLLLELEQIRRDSKLKEDEWKNQIEILAKTVEHLQNNIELLSADISDKDALINENKILKTNIEEMKRSLDDNKSQLASAVKSCESAVQGELTARDRIEQSHTKTLNALKEILQDKELQLEKIQNRVTVLQREKNLLENENVRLHEEIKVGGKLQSDMESSLNALRRELQERRSVPEFEIKEVEAQFNSEIINLQKQLETKNNTILEARRAVQEVKNELEIVKTRSAQDKIELERKKGSINDFEKGIMQIREDAEMRLELQNEQWRVQVNALQSKLETQFSKERELKNEVKLLKQKLEDSDRSASTFTQRSRNTERELLKDYHALQREVTDGKLRLQSISSELEATREAFNSNKEELITIQKELVLAKLDSSELQKAKKDIISFTENITELKQLLHAKDSELLKRQNIIEELTFEKETFGKKIEKMEGNIEFRERQIMEEKKTQEKKMYDAQASNVTLSKQYKDLNEEMSKLNLEISELKRKLQCNEMAIQEYDIKFMDLTKECEREAAAKKELQQQLTEAKNSERTAHFTINSITNDLRRVENATTEHCKELEIQLEQSNERTQTLLRELQHVRQSLKVSRLEVSALETRLQTESAATQRNVIDPLKKEIELVRSQLKSSSSEVLSCNRALQDHKSKIQELLTDAQEMKNDAHLKCSRIATLENELSLMKQLEDELRYTQKELSLEKGNRSKARTLEQQLQILTKELQESREREAQQLRDLSQKRTDLSVLREEYTNLEILKTQNDAAIADYRKREYTMLSKIEELHDAQVMMQTCFNKQQEQLELNAKLSEKV